MTTGTIGAAPTVREILAAGLCAPSCILSTLEPERCGCRKCEGRHHGAALAALGLLSQPQTASEPSTPDTTKSKRKHRRRRRR